MGAQFSNCTEILTYKLLLLLLLVHNHNRIALLLYERIIKQTEREIENKMRIITFLKKEWKSNK